MHGEQTEFPDPFAYVAIGQSTQEPLLAGIVPLGHGVHSSDPEI